MTHLDLLQKLELFTEGDMLLRADITDRVVSLCREWEEKKGKLSGFFTHIRTYLESLSFREPVESFFRILALFLHALDGQGNKDPKDKRMELMKHCARDIREIIQGNPITLPEKSISRHSASKMKFTFTKEDEANLDYSGIVTESNMLSTYTGEVKEFLESAQSALLDLEHDSENKEAINKVFRCFHTIKSSSAFLGMKNIEVLSHYMENMLGKIRDGDMSLNPDLTDIVFHGIGIIRDLVQVVEKTEPLAEKFVQGFNAFELYSYIQIVEQITEESQNKRIGEILKDLGALDDGTLQKILKKQEESDEVFGKIALDEKAVTEEDLEKAVQKQVSGKEQQHQSRQSYVRVNAQRLNTLVDMVGELVVNQSMIREKIHKNDEDVSEQDVNQLESITTTIKDIVLSMGMVPMDEMFQKLRVVIRNTARELDKMVRLQIEGGDTEMDRNLVESIYDPLVHMVRNSVSHGIELPGVREKSGKNPVGEIRISAQYKGNGIEVVVSDDGRGIPKEEVVNKAISLGMVSKEQKEKILSDPQQVYSLLFKPGFSTRDKADKISGRGVGMDVVQQNVSRINGKIDIQSQEGKGTSVRIKLPLTLAIIDGFVTEIHGEFYVFPFDTIEQILVPEDTTLVPMEEEYPMVLSRGQYFVLVDLFQLLTGEAGEYQDRFVYIHVHYDGKDLAIPVNRVIGKQEIVIKNLNEMMRRQKLFSGGTIFGDGSIGFILDLEEIIQVFHKGSLKNERNGG